MIRYTLACEHGHAFESWFPSGAAFDEQSERGFVACPVCGSPSVAKTLMAPAIARTDRGPRTTPVAQAPESESAPPSPAPAASIRMIAEPERRLRALLRAVREEVTRNADDVGARFPNEARAMHYGEVPARAIYGEASADDAKALIDEGIAVAPLPPCPDDHN